MIHKMDSVGDMVNQGLIVKVNGKYDAVRFLVPLCSNCEWMRVFGLMDTIILIYFW